MKFGIVLSCLTYAVLNIVTIADRGVPHYLIRGNVRYVGFSVSTIFGIVHLNLDFPGIYENSHPVDFQGVSNLVRENVDSIFEHVSRSRSVFDRFQGPLRLYDRNFETVWMDSNIGMVKEEIRKVLDGLASLYRKVTRRVFEASVSRIDSLGEFHHSFSKLLSKVDRESAELNGSTLEVNSDHCKLSDSFTDLSLVVWGRGGAATSVDSIAHYFDHETLNRLISSDKGPLLIGAYPSKAKQVSGDLKMRVSVDHTGQLCISCKDDAGRVVLKVGDRNKLLQVSRGLGELRAVNWDNVSQVCRDLKIML